MLSKALAKRFKAKILQVYIQGGIIVIKGKETWVVTYTCRCSSEIQSVYVGP